jgi:hypothetical protein
MTTAQYGFDAFTSDVERTLVAAYEDDIQRGDKAIIVKPGTGRRKADVVPSIEFRRYHSFSTRNEEDFDAGIYLRTMSGKRVVNYPRQHADNLTRKHQNTQMRFKPLVRVFKNIRSKLVDDVMIYQGDAPSYFIEGLLYNVPNERFGTTYRDSFVGAFNWLADADAESLTCANEIHPLVRDDSNTSWPKEKYERFMTPVQQLWQNW